MIRPSESVMMSWGVDDQAKAMLTVPLPKGEGRVKVRDFFSSSIWTSGASNKSIRSGRYLWQLPLLALAQPYAP